MSTKTRITKLEKQAGDQGPPTIEWLHFDHPWPGPPGADRWRDPQTGNWWIQLSFGDDDADDPDDAVQGEPTPA